MYHRELRRAVPSLVRFVVLVLAACLGLASCAWIDLRALELRAWPDRPNQVLPSLDSPLWVDFQAEPDRGQAEAAIQVQSPRGRVSGDYDWDGSRCYFRPREPWEPGLRYSLTIGCPIAALDGRQTRRELRLSFYALRSQPGPRLLDFSPADGASTSVYPDQDAVLVLHFSEAMRRESVEAAFSIQPRLELSYEWADEDRSLCIRPGGNLSPLSLYQWRLASSAMASDGARLVSAYEASFLTAADTAAPVLTSLLPLCPQAEGWVCLPGLGLLECHHGLRLSFSEAMRRDGMRAAIRIDPPLGFNLEPWSDSEFDLIPDARWRPEGRYRLVLGPGLADLSGLPLGGVSEFYFTVATPYLRVAGLRLADGLVQDWPEANTVITASLGTVDGDLVFSLEFNRSFLPEARLASIDAIQLRPFFPGGELGTPRLKRMLWPTDYLVELMFTGLRPGQPAQDGQTAQPHYYQLVLAGTAAGLADGLGSYLEDSLSLFFEVW